MIKKIIIIGLLALPMLFISAGMFQTIGVAAQEPLSLVTVYGSELSFSTDVATAPGIVTVYGNELSFTTAAVTPGVVTVYGNELSFTTLSIPLVSISVSPSNPSLLPGRTQQFTANGTYSDSSTANLTSTANWTSSNTGVATISAAGLATSIAPGTTNITASYGTVSGNTTLTVRAPQALVDLRTAGAFAVLAGSTVTSNGATIVNGDIGLSPGSAVTGFPPGIVNGTIYVGDATAAQAKLDLTTAFNDAQSRSTGAISLPGNLGGLTFTPGLYSNSSSSGISGTGANAILTLDAQGDANAVFIFKMASTLTTDTGTSIVLSGGARAANIYWQVGTSATLGTNSFFKGTILADQSITLTTGARLDGRALARIGAVTLDTNIVTAPVLVSIAVTPPNPSIALSLTQQFTANATYADNSTADITGSANWTSSNTGVATIGLATGLATSVAAGTTNITATWGSISGNTTLTVIQGATVNISVVLQGGQRPDAGWVVPLTVKLFPQGVDVMTATANYTSTQNTTKVGSTGVVQLTGITPGTYDITVKSAHTLLNVKTNVGILQSTISVNMGTLLEGNAKEDTPTTAGLINILDFSVLSASYGKLPGDNGYTANADFDRNGLVNILDFSLLSSNYGKSSPITIP